MSKKVTWHDIYSEFRASHPKLRNEITGWQPQGYLSIVLTCKDGRKMTYDYLTKRCYFI